MRLERIARGGGSLEQRDATRRDGLGIRAAAVLVAGILVGCSPGGAPTTPVLTTPAQPGVTEPAQPGMTQSPSPAAPGSPADAFAVTAITYSEDEASLLAAVAELGPNDAGVSRLDLYRDAEGRLGSAVVHREAGLPAVITFDTTQRPVRIEAGGYVAELSYPSSDVEVVVTAPDGSVIRERGPLNPGAAIPGPRAPTARLAAFMEEPPPPGKARWPLTVRTYGTVLVEVKHTGVNPGTVLDHVAFSGLRCTAEGGTGCAVEMLASRAGARIDVTSTVSTGDDAKADTLIWRTREDCDKFAPYAEKLVSDAGWGALAVSGLYQVVALAGAGYPPLGAALYSLGAVIKIWGPGAVFKPACGRVPNLQALEDSVLDRVSGATAAITLTAAGDCDDDPETGWRINEPTQTLTLQPFLPPNRSPFGASRSEASEIGTITFNASDCAVAMGGTFDLVASAVTAGVPKAAAATWAALFTENVILLEIKDADRAPSVPIDVTGTFTLTLTSPDCCGRGVPAGCTSTQTTKGVLRGMITQADGYLAEGLATVSTVDSKFSCAAPHAADQTVKWTAVGDAQSLHGAIVMPAQGGAPAMSLLFTVKAW